MARIKLEPPSEFLFSTELEVRIGDTNYGGHLGNDSLLSLLHEARLRFLQSFGWSEFAIAGSGLIMTDCAIVYKSEAFLRDLLKIEMAVFDVNKYGFDLFYKVEKKETGKEVAAAKTGLVFFDYAKKKMVQTPEEFLKRFPKKASQQES